MSHLNFWILAFSTNFCPFKTDLSGNTVWPQALGFQKLAKLSIFGIFNLLLSTQNVNVARFARNVEWDFLEDFQTPCSKGSKDFSYTIKLIQFVELLDIGREERWLLKNGLQKRPFARIISWRERSIVWTFLHYYHIP